MTRRHTSSLAEPFYIGRMNAAATGSVATEMLKRLNAALAPTSIELTDDSEQHRGHGGYNPAGESHFSLRIESAAFAGKSRVERQRMVYAALGDLMKERVHALSIRATAPGEP
jgi:BolA protein